MSVSFTCSSYSRMNTSSMYCPSLCFYPALFFVILLVLFLLVLCSVFLRLRLFVGMVFLAKSIRAPPLLHKNILCVLSRSTWLGECEPPDPCQAPYGHPSDCKSIAAFSSLKATLRSVTSAVGNLFFGFLLILFLLFFDAGLVRTPSLGRSPEHLDISFPK